MLGINVTAATTENPDGRAVMNPCDDACNAYVRNQCDSSDY